MTKLQILIIDDDPDDREMFCEAIKAIGLNVNCSMSKSGTDALEDLNKSETLLPDLIFLDLNMPRLSGKQCLSLFKASDKLLEIPIVVYTTSKMQKDIDDTTRLGAASFLTKPDNLNDLKHCLKEIITSRINEHQANQQVE